MTQNSLINTSEMIKVVPGIPAEFEDYIVSRRIRIISDFPGFLGDELRLLDAGCGSGCSLLQLCNFFKDCHGFDVNEDYIQRLLEEVAIRNIANCSASTGDLCNLEFDSESVDRLISFEVIEHLPDENAGVKSMYRVLKPGGLAAFSVPNKWWVFETHGAYLPLLRWDRVPFFSWLPKPIHERYAKARIYTKQRIVKLLASVGFKVLKVSYVTAPMDRLTIKPLQKLVKSTVLRNDTTNIPMFSTAIMVIAAKENSKA
ncbi:class I SAM-dependent methyltransferase [Gimesia aquarii]|uniref:Putative S-adenosylmethionine-dependent methyltransferase n=1 Tax=Gimesia aquarii TaxID=2527964 RepID=A0A517WXB2_9PLAN|nr:class I SAM-dependent methyltransferase [Gimesia aquarii]QDU09852.1 putative S-adenosylmethionine-dependent methyltransferase [Gimesia aquarii]